jgi:hypothetical protein
VFHGDGPGPRPARSACFFFGGALGGRDRFEALVRDHFPALDRDAVCSGCKARLRTLHGRELLAQVVREPRIELVLIEIGAQIPGVLLVRLLTRVLVPAPGECSLDSLALGGQQLARPLGIHEATLPDGGRLGCP